MMSTSRNPRVVTRAVGPPLRSRMALVATVVAIRISPTSARRNGRIEARRSIPSRTARAGSAGVLRVFANHEPPLASSRRTRSVKVPPVSIASRSIGSSPFLPRSRLGPGSIPSRPLPVPAPAPVPGSGTYRPVNFGRSLARNARNPIWKSSVS